MRHFYKRRRKLGRVSLRKDFWDTPVSYCPFCPCANDVRFSVIFFFFAESLMSSKDWMWMYPPKAKTKWPLPKGDWRWRFDYISNLKDYIWKILNEPSSLQCMRFLWVRECFCFLCHKIKDGGYNKTNINKQLWPAQNTPALQAMNVAVISSSPLLPYNFFIVDPGLWEERSHLCLVEDFLITGTKVTVVKCTSPKQPHIWW